MRAVSETEVVYLGQPPLRIDLLRSIDGVAPSMLDPQRSRRLVGRLPIRVIALDDLIANKLAAGRPETLPMLSSSNGAARGRASERACASNVRTARGSRPLRAQSSQRPAATEVDPTMISNSRSQSSKGRERRFACMPLSCPRERAEARQDPPPGNLAVAQT
jgi:hypothetical protein